MNILIMIVAVLVLIGGAAFLVANDKPDPNDFDKVERFVDKTGPSKYAILIVIFSIAFTLAPGVWGMASLAKGQWLIGAAVLLAWCYPYWLLLNYFNNRSLLKVRVGFSLILTLLMLAFTFWVNKTPTPSIDTNASYVQRLVDKL